jgi:hypothetical protein
VGAPPCGGGVGGGGWVPPPPPTTLRPLPDHATRVRRRRLAVLVAGLVLVGAGFVGVRALAGLAQVGASSGPEAVDVGPLSATGDEYVVQPGDTLWSIALQIAPDSDPRAVVDRLRELNGGPALEVGDRLDLDIG